MRHSRSFKNYTSRDPKSRRRGRAGGGFPGMPCGVNSTSCRFPTTPVRPPTKDCPPQRECPPQQACPPQKCPPQRECPPQKLCPPHECAPCPEVLCPDCEVCDCPPAEPCPECEACPECDDCPEYGCEDACITLHGYETDDYYKCIEKYCDEGRPTTPTTRPELPIAVRPWDPPRPPGPGLTATFRPNEPDPDCVAACEERYYAGEITKAEMKTCLYNCCFAEAIANGHSADLAARLCRDPVPGRPTPGPTCEQRCRGKYGVNTQGYFDCVKRNCTITSTYRPPGGAGPYIP